MENEIKTWLTDNQIAVQEISEFLPEEKDTKNFQKDIKTMRAIERNIEIIGEAVNRILTGSDKKAKAKIYYNLDKAKLGLDPKLFKKLTDDIWEFRTKYAGLQYRLFAFWDRTGETETLVISTHGMVKKTDKVPKA